MFQYAHLRQRAGQEQYECPYWKGEDYFGFKDSRPNRKSQDIGYKFPKHSSWYDKELFQNLFRPSEEWRQKLDAQWTENGDCKVIGLHVRRGDYKTKSKHTRWCFLTPLRWYTDCISENLSDVKNLFVYLASDESNDVYDELSPLCPLPILRPQPNNIDSTFWDFVMLTRCDYMMISNSTFGFAASMLNERAKMFWRPQPLEQKLISYNPWNTTVVIK
ncbi:MAG: alpha-1,2-fucosyltransferase [Candidatus Thorarchaeota archaeon]